MARRLGVSFHHSLSRVEETDFFPAPYVTAVMVLQEVSRFFQNALGKAQANQRHVHLVRRWLASCPIPRHPP